jgi:hypothetical protein
MKIVLPKERPLSWNKVYTGQHWTKRAAEAKRVHQLVRHFGDPPEMQQFGPQTAWPAAVDITITAYFKNRPLDADNISSKFYIDGLKGWLIKDDTQEYVRSVTTRSCVDKDNPRVELLIEEVA